jgi:hypothetical protein
MAIHAPITGAQRTSGPVLFARYAYPPNRLGLCGPEDAPALLESAASGDDGELRALALGFAGAYPYLRLIAGDNGLEDALDARVVEAYWIGNELTRGVRARSLHRDLDGRFRARMAPRAWRWLETALETGSWPVHAFHVLEIFPRIGLLRGGDGGPIVQALDACRIRWGRVTSVDEALLEVESRPLEMVDGRLALGPPRSEAVTAWMGEGGPLGGVQPGDLVSLHWGWACDRISPLQGGRLAAWTRAALDVANETT